jgi:hypothetical protein
MMEMLFFLFSKAKVRTIDEGTGIQITALLTIITDIGLRVIRGAMECLNLCR